MECCATKQVSSCHTTYQAFARAFQPEDAGEEVETERILHENVEVFGQNGVVRRRRAVGQLHGDRFGGRLEIGIKLVERDLGRSMVKAIISQVVYTLQDH